MRMRVWVLGLVVACASGCASQRFAQAPPVNPQIAAEVVVIHTGASRDERMLTLDGQAIVTLPHGSFTHFAVQPGPHWLGVGCAGVLRLSWTAKNHPFIADPRTNYYFVVAPAPGCAKVEPLSESQAQDLMSDRTYRPVLVAHPTS